MKYIPVNIPLLVGNEKKYLTECIDSGWISSEGPFVEKFEKEFAKFVGRKYAVAVTNGTVALDLAVQALGIKKGDEVIVPSFTIISCVLQIVRIGGVPVLIDSDPLSWNMDVKKIEEKITKKTKAIMAVHIYSHPVDMDPLLALAEKYNLQVIEDSAQMHGQKYKNRMCGSFGDVSTFSFYPNKIITTGEGGMVLTDNEALFHELQLLRNLYFNNNFRFVHAELGWNARMTNMQAALGCAQLEQINEFILKKRRIGSMYHEALKDLPNISLSEPRTAYSDNHYWVFGIVLKNKDKISAKNAIEGLHREGVGTRPFFCPMDMQPVLNRMKVIDSNECSISRFLYQQGFYIPSGLGMKDEEVEYVAEKTRLYLSSNA